MVNNNPNLPPIGPQNPKEDVKIQDDRVTRSPRMSIEQWEHLIKIMKETEKPKDEQ